MALDASSPASATTFNNPGFKEPRSRNGVSVTDASGKPYSGIRNGAGTAGSVASMSTTVTSVSNGSTLESVTRSPLRSSLKKPRPRPDPTLGIQNPGYSGSGSSPPMRRSGSVKKVRIQTHSTEVQTAFRFIRLAKRASIRIKKNDDKNNYKDCVQQQQQHKTTFEEIQNQWTSFKISLTNRKCVNIDINKLFSFVFQICRNVNLYLDKVRI